MIPALLHPRTLYIPKHPETGSFGIVTRPIGKQIVFRGNRCEEVTLFLHHRAKTFLSLCKTRNEKINEKGDQGENVDKLAGVIVSLTFLRDNLNENEPRQVS